MSWKYDKAFLSCLKNGTIHSAVFLPYVHKIIVIFQIELNESKTNTFSIGDSNRPNAVMVVVVVPWEVW